LKKNVSQIAHLQDGFHFFSKQDGFQSVDFVGRATRSLKKNQNGILSFKKNLTKNLDVGNIEFYRCVKFEPQIPYIRGTRKLTKSNRF
jgi:hypothetical protein